MKSSFFAEFNGIRNYDGAFVLAMREAKSKVHPDSEISEANNGGRTSQRNLYQQ